MRICALIINIILLCSVTALHAASDGTALMMLGGSASMLGRADTGVAYFGSDTFFLNPSSIAKEERFVGSFNFGNLLLDYYNPSVVAGFPTSYGVIGGAFRMISGSDTLNGYQFVLGGAKEFTKRLSMGASLSLLLGNGPDSGAYFTGINIGSIYQTKINADIGSGFGIYLPSIGFSINAGLPMGNDKDFADLNQITIGYTLPLYKRNDIQVSLLNDLSFVQYDELAVKVGAEAVYKNSYIVRTGFMSPDAYHYADFTLGAGYRLTGQEYQAEFNYALVHYKKTDFVHYVGTQIRYGKLDKEPPQTSIKASERYISPNTDGVQDFVLFNLTVSDTSKIGGWRLQIKNDAGTVVKEYRVSDRDVEESLTLKTFIQKIWTPRESAVVPETIFWDGTDANSNILPDGDYVYAFMAWDERDNISPEVTGVVTIDNTAPAVELTVEDRFFSPNNDGRKDTLKIIQAIKTQSNDMWQASFVDKSGKIVKRYSWQGTDVPKALIWDGKDDAGNDVPEGLYTYQIQCTDNAGNKANALVREISLTRQYQTVDISASLEYFSYSLHNTITFTPSVSDTKDLVKWQFVITNEKDKPVYQLEGQTVPKTITWDCKDNKGQKLNDGIYRYRFTAEYLSGNNPQSFVKSFILDSTPPDVDLAYEPKLFSPDGDGENDILTITPSINDNVGVKNWEITIYAPAGYVFKTFKGTDVPTELKWDGIGINNELVESAADYFVELSATDITGNTAKTKRIKLPIDVLVMVTERGLKIRISNIEFAFDSAKLTGKAFPILNRVTEILNKYEKYNVLIEGHTDDIGEEQYNLKLSEARAKSVLDYLISKGIDKKRLSSRGLGESSPFMPNTSVENRRRNRRVEFLLIKPEEIMQDKR
ncbi:MAG: gliding motility-associated C-terminal domain-containing protein [Spirochaetes bacterium]|nr:gliding motility-associated C-terminal domain-containing protein [Spirochaetota bacterium]